MTHTYTINNTTANTGTITFGGAGGLTNQPLGKITISSGGAGSTSTFGGAGQIYTTTGTNTTWATPNSEVMRINQTNPPELEVKGRLVLNGQDLEERLDTIEKVLQIPERDVKLEKKHPKLKKLYDDYINALGKYRTFEAIKGDDDGTT